MSKLYDYLERIREQTTADELNVRTSKEGLTFIFGWTSQRPKWWFQKHYSWGELDHARDWLVIRDVTAAANDEIAKHNALVNADAYARAMGVVK